MRGVTTEAMPRLRSVQVVVWGLPRLGGARKDGSPTSL